MRSQNLGRTRDITITTALHPTRNQLLASLPHTLYTTAEAWAESAPRDGFEALFSIYLEMAQEDQKLMGTRNGIRILVSLAVWPRNALSGI